LFEQYFVTVVLAMKSYLQCSQIRLTVIDELIFVFMPMCASVCQCVPACAKKSKYLLLEGL
jgi:hypothetical protein